MFLLQAIRYRQKAAAKLAQPLTSAQTARPIGSVGQTGVSPALKSDKAARCEAKALEYERKGNLAKAQRNREKAWRIREKHSIPHPVGAQHPSTYAGYTQNMTAVPTTSGTTFVPTSNAVPMNNMGAANTMPMNNMGAANTMPMNNMGAANTMPMNNMGAANTMPMTGTTAGVLPATRY
jgi:hypothetical protein